MRRVLNLPQFVVLEYKRHDTSLSDNSSFRNTTAWRSDKAASGTEGQPSSGTGRSSSSSGHRNSGTQKDSNSSSASGGNNSGRFSRERFDKSSSSSSSSRPAWGRDGSAKRGTTLSKSVSVDGSESSKNQEESSSGEVPNAWHSK